MDPLKFSLMSLSTLSERILSSKYCNFRPIIRELCDFQRQKIIVAGNLPVRII